VSTSDQPEELAPVHALRELPQDTAVVAYRNLPAMRVRLRFSYRDAALRRLGLGTGLDEDVDAEWSRT
jgi:type IV secretion system protein VirD4